MKYLITTVDGKERTHDLNSRNEEALFEQLLNSKLKVKKAAATAERTVE